MCRLDLAGGAGGALGGAALGLVTPTSAHQIVLQTLGPLGGAGADGSGGCCDADGQVIGVGLARLHHEVGRLHILRAPTGERIGAAHGVEVAGASSCGEKSAEDEGEARSKAALPVIP